MSDNENGNNGTPVINQNGNPKKSKVPLIMGAIVIILLAVIAIGGYVLYAALNKPAPVTQVGSYVIDENNLEEVMGEMQEKLETGLFEVSMNTTWNFTAGNPTSSDAYIANSASNTKSIVFEVVLDDTGESIYKSTIIPVGSALKELTFDKALENGRYNATCTYTLINDDGTEFSTAAFAVFINVT